MCYLIIAVGPCLVLISITEDIVCSLDALDEKSRMNQDKHEITQQFNEFIQFHSSAKQLSEPILNTKI